MPGATRNPVALPQKISPGLAAIEFDRVLDLIALEAKSDLGQAAVRARRPRATRRECELAHFELAEMVRFYLREGLMPLAGLADPAPLLGGESVLELPESWQIIRSVRAANAIRETFLRSDAYPRLREIASTIPELRDLLSHAARYFTVDGKLREEASAELRSIRSRSHAKRQAIQKNLSDLMSRHADAIQEPLITIRGDRYCIPVRSDHRTSVPGILHERSGSGASFFIEPLGVVELNNDLAELLQQEREEIARITRFISQQIIAVASEILESSRVAGELDAVQACALFFDRSGSVTPTFSEDRELRLLDGRHPLLDERMASARAYAFGESEGEKSVVPTTISLDSASPALVISGPNAGGKTVALKTVGLLVAMGLSGLPVPAREGTRLPVVDDIHVLIGDDQSVLEHLSTFSAYLTRLKRVLQRVTPKSLVLLDELGSGTDPEEGAALAASVIEHLLESGCLTMVTTHLSALKTFAVDDGRIINASMEFDSATARPTFRLIVGVPGRSRALDAAQMIGLPSSIIDAARARLGDRYGETDQLLADLQRRMSEVLALEDAVKGERTALERASHEVETKAAALEKERLRLGGTYRDELDRLKDETGRRLNAELRQLREAEKNSRGQINAARVFETITRPIDQALEFVPGNDAVLRPGDKAEHRRLRMTGVVASIDGSRAVLTVGGKKVTVELRELSAVAGGRPAEKVPAKHRPVGVSRASQPSEDDVTPVVSAELNLIGQRVEEALDESDKFLDRALLEGRPAVRIIHGYGTGTLRKAIREHLRRHPGVKSFRPGADNEGGDGATIAVLDS
jgi:DNA mismatch repair protein MutS2